MASPIVFEQQDKVGYLTINRPERRNALDNDALDALIDWLMKIRRLPLVALVVTGEGDKAFCAGSDLKALAAYSAEEAELHTHLFQAMTEALDELPVATIAAIEGACLGGGLEIALACDLRLAAENARFGFPEITVGALPTGGGTVRAPRAIGLARAREMMIFGEAVDAVTARDWGLVSRLEPTGAVRDAARAKAEALAGRTNRDAVMLLKTMLVTGAGLSPRAGQALAYLGDFGLLRSAQFKADVGAWAEKNRTK